MSAAKIKIWTLFLIFLFVQRMGAAMLVKVYIQELVYKEKPSSTTSQKDGKLNSKKLLCSNNRIYEECQSTFEHVSFSAPLQRITFLVINYKSVLAYRQIGTFLKKSSLRGPPFC